MAQLIKLKDYVSRYEWNAYRYPTQYIRLKREKWDDLHHVWLNHRATFEQEEISNENETPFEKIKAFLKRQTPEQKPLYESLEHTYPQTEHELRQFFLDQLFPFQLKWATSTVTEVSFMDQSFYEDETLKYFLHRFPDIYLLMYYPVFNVRKAPVDGEIILISPLQIEIIYLLEEEESVVFMASDERTWTKEDGTRETRILSPLFALRRNEQMIRSILNKDGIDFPIQKTVLSRSNDIIFNVEPYNVNIVGRRQYEKWFQDKRNLSSPLKNLQLRAMDALLKYCLSQSIRRPEWKDEDFEMEE